MDNNDNKDLLFLKCFRNIYIKNIILNYLKLYNLNNNQIKFLDLKSLNNYKFKYYLNSIYLYLDINDPLLSEISEIIPYNIKKIEIEFIRKESSYYLSYNNNNNNNNNQLEQQSQQLHNINDNENNNGEQIEQIENINNHNNNNNNYNLNNSFINSNNLCQLESLIIHISPYYNNLIRYIKNLPNSIIEFKIINKGLMFVNKNYQLKIPNDFFPINKSLLETLELPMSNFDPRNTPNLLNFSLYFQGNTSISSQVPNSVLNLKLQNFNNTIQPNDLPKRLQSFEICDHFNQPIRPSILPSSITNLVLGSNFNQPLSNGWLKCLNNLIYLKFGFSFNQSIPSDSLSSKLKFLIFGSSFRKPLGGGGSSLSNLPESLEELVLPEYYSLKNLISFPKNLKSFKYGSGVFYDSSVYLGSSNLPPNLTNLQCNEYSNYNIYPYHLKSITFNCGTTSSLTTQYDESFSPIIPNTVEFIKFINLRKLFNNQFFKNCTQNNLKSIDFDDTFNLPISNNNVLPNSITYLSFGKCFNQQFSITTLPCLKSLKFGYYFNNGGIKLNLNQYSSIKTLQIDYHYNFIIDDSLPPNLETLIINDYILPINFNNLPSTLKYLIISGTNSIFLNNQLNNLNEDQLKLIKII